MQQQEALTLIELAVVLTIMSLLAAMSAPGLSSWLSSIRINSSVNQLVHSFHLAHRYALETGISTVLCSSPDGRHCRTDDNWNDGWLIFNNLDGDHPATVDHDEPVVHSVRTPSGLQIRANRNAFVLRPFGRRSTNGTVTFCDPHNARHTRSVVVSYTGKARMAHLEKPAADCLSVSR